MEVTTAIIIRTLIGSGFELINTSRQPSYLAFHTIRHDEFGSKLHYLFAFSGAQKLSNAELIGLRRIAAKDNASLIVIGDTDSTGEKDLIFPADNFVARLGGSITSFLPLENYFAKHLRMLGRNSVPKKIIGKADDLFEAYVQSGLEFLLQERVVRYGQERRFETVPDGIILGRSELLLLYDCKAAQSGYSFNRDSIRQFADYVNNFNRRYEQLVGRLYAFLVVSGYFQSPTTLDSRSEELYSECGVRLVCLTADEMGKIVEMLAERPAFRKAIDWKSIFSATIITAKAVKRNLEARIRDKVISSQQGD